ncbi:MAG: DUF1499 domain-containing protein [Gammaproteobacteria bacterium]|nr:DUF1499 domain-containing protein [Gammaproteobacteria bacterium]
MLAMNTSSAELPACPDSPNCVSSQATDERHRIDPLAFSGSPGEALARLKRAVLSEPRMTIVAEEGAYLQCEARSLIFRFVDDLAFQLDAAQGVIHVRSASRTGHSDFGVNRRRVERIRQAFSQQQ